MPSLRADRRIERTRQALMRALVDLLLSEDLESITIASIVARADVGRSTFYTHFRGRDDILKASLSFPSAPLARIVGAPGGAARDPVPPEAVAEALIALTRAAVAALLATPKEGARGN